MFESAELGHKVDKDVYEAEAPKLREALLDAQYELDENAQLPGHRPDRRRRRRRQGRRPSTRSTMDGPAPHRDHGIGQPTDEERRAADMWRFWRALPPTRQDRHLLRLLVHAAHPRPRLRARRRRRARRGDRGDRALRADARRRGRAAPEVLVPPVEEGSRSKRLQGAGEGPGDALARRRRRLGALQALRRLPHHLRARACARPAPWSRAVDRRRGRATRATATSRSARPCSRRCASVWTSPRTAPATPPPPPAAQRRRARRCSTRSTCRQRLAKKRYEDELEELQGRLNTLSREPKFRERSVRRGVRGQRRGRQGRRHPPRHRGARRALLPRHADRRADRRGARAALPVALLAPPPAARPHRDLRPLLVRPRAGRAGRGLRARGRLDARLRRDQRLRGAARRARRIVVKFWLHDRQGRAAAPLQGARGDRLQALQDHRRGLAQPREVGRLRRTPSTT